LFPSFPERILLKEVLAKPSKNLPKEVSIPKIVGEGIVETTDAHNVAESSICTWAHFSIACEGCVEGIAGNPHQMTVSGT